MYEVYFYQDKNGNEPVRNYLNDLEQKSLSNKEDRVKFNKIDQYIEILRMYGTTAGEPYMKHLEGEIWELRPLRDRILFFYYEKGAFILLNCFMKKTQKTPKKEIAKAKKLINDFKKRSAEHE